MTVTELRKRAEELEAEGFGDVQVTLIDEFARRKNSNQDPTESMRRMSSNRIAGLAGLSTIRERILFS